MRFQALPLLASVILSLPALAQEAVPTANEAQNLMSAGRLPEAAAAWKQRADANADDGQAHFMYAYALHMNGDLDEAHDAHIAAARFPQFTTLALYNHACVHALKNERDAAFQALAEAVEAGFTNVSQIDGDSDMDSLRGDGRLDALRLKMEGAVLTNLAALPPARRFDFYVGDWAMQNDGRAERYLSARSAFDGLGLRVASTDTQGASSAESLFLHDEAAGVWRQVWMRRDGMTVVLEGGLSDGAMVLRMVSENGEAKTNGRSVFREIGANGFVYDWQETADGGQTWETKATRTFARRVAG